MTTPTKTGDRRSIISGAINSPFFLATAGSIIALAVLGVLVATT